MSALSKYVVGDRSRVPPISVLVALALLAALPGCSREAETAAPKRGRSGPSPSKREAGVPITMTGRIEAEDEVARSFRIGGRILESDLKVGDRVEARSVDRTP